MAVSIFFLGSVVPSAWALPARFFGLTAHETAYDQAPEYGEPNWTAMQNAGVKVFRMQIKWEKVVNAAAPWGQTWKGEAGWKFTYDEYFTAAAKHGIAILPVLFTREKGNREYYCTCDPAYQTWKEFVTKVVKRYGQGGSFWNELLAQHPTYGQYPISTWEVWNEPNLGENSPSGTIDGGTYAQFLKGTAETIHTAQRVNWPADGSTVLFGGLYQDASEKPGISIQKYLEQAKASVPDIASRYDGLSLHPYALNGEEEVKYTGATGEIAQDAAVQQNVMGTAKPLWITEFGWPITGKDGKGVDVGHASPEEQASLLSKTYAWLKQNQVTFNIQFAAWFDYQDISTNPSTHWDQHTGLREVNGIYRPAWYAYERQAGVPEWPNVPSVWPSDNLGGVVSADPGIASWGKERLDVIVRGTNSGLYDKFYNGGVGWSAWEAIPQSSGRLAGGPDATSWANGRIDVVGRGVGANGSPVGPTLHWSWDKSNPQWFFDEFLKELPIEGDPAISSWGPERLDVFARGSNGHLWHRWFDHGIWGQWEEIPFGTFVGGPSAVSWSEGRIDVVARGTSGQVVHWSWDKSDPKWYFNELPGGGEITSDPAISSWGPGRLDVFARGSDYRLVHRWYNTPEWGPWESLGGPALGGSPDAVSWGLKRIDVVAREWDDSVYHAAWNEK